MSVPKMGCKGKDRYAIDVCTEWNDVKFNQFNQCNQDGLQIWQILNIIYEIHGSKRTLVLPNSPESHDLTTIGYTNTQEAKLKNTVHTDRFRETQGQRLTMPSLFAQLYPPAQPPPVHMFGIVDPLVHANVLNKINTCFHFTGNQRRLILHTHYTN